MVHLGASGWSTTHLNAQIIPFHPLPTSQGAQYQGSVTTITFSQSLDVMMGPLTSWDDDQGKQVLILLIFNQLAWLTGLLIVIIDWNNWELSIVSLKRKQDFVGISPKWRTPHSHSHPFGNFGLIYVFLGACQLGFAVKQEFWEWDPPSKSEFPKTSCFFFWKAY